MKDCNLTDALTTLRIDEPVAVAYSAGRDSSALLHAALHASTHPVVALHVHHGLSPHADAWEEHARQQCQTWAQAGHRVTFISHRETTRPAQGASIEAWARDIRYRALAQQAQACGIHTVLLAHHQQDQAETFLLQALRGAGLRGLASMPSHMAHHGITWRRPWLAQPRARIEHYLATHQLSYIDDDSNQHLRFERNRLRQKIWPALTHFFPQAAPSLSTCAQWAQEATSCLQELAEQDLRTITHDQALHLAPWQALSPARQSNALRHWLAQQTQAPVSAHLVQRLQHELPQSTQPGTWLCPKGQLQRYRGQLSFTPAPSTPTQARPPPETHLHITAPGSYELPGWQGTLHVQACQENGVPLHQLAHLELRPRQGQEQFQAGPGRPPRSLKKQYQSAHIPPWARLGPLIYQGPTLIFVPGLGIDARLQIRGKAPLFHLTWEAKICHFLTP